MLANINNTTFWDVVWWMIIFTCMVLWVWMFIACFADNFARHDHSGWAKAMWTLIFIILPFFGCLIYLIARPAKASA